MYIFKVQNSKIYSFNKRRGENWLTNHTFDHENAWPRDALAICDGQFANGRVWLTVVIFFDGLQSSWLAVTTGKWDPIDYDEVARSRSRGKSALLEMRFQHLPLERNGCFEFHVILGEAQSTKISVVRESIAYPYMDFQNSMDFNMDIHDFWMSVFNYPYKCGYPHWYSSSDIYARTFCNGYP